MRSVSPVILLLIFAAAAAAQPHPLPDAPADFVQFLSARISSASDAAGGNGTPAPAKRIEDICPIDKDPVAARVFAEYGAMFIVDKNALPPDTCIFADGSAVDAFQKTVDVSSADFGGTVIELQSGPMQSLLAARSEAEALGLRITPLDGAVAGRRSFADTVRLWQSRYFPALTHWVRQGTIAPEEADAVGFETRRQIEKVIEWEGRGYLFARGYSKSIFNSVAPPGTSQHLAMLAFDVVEHGNPRIREILNRHGWFQTIVNDSPHFTYLGVPESELPQRGLRAVFRGGHTFWVPNVNIRR